MKTKFIFLVLLLFGLKIIAQPTEKSIKVIVAPDHLNWEYKIGEPVKFTISVIQNGNLLPNTKIKYEIGPEKMNQIKLDSTISKIGMLVLDPVSMATSGFLRCIATVNVEGKEYRNLATAAIEPLKLEPAVSLPSDFTTFWNSAKSDLAKIPFDTKMTLLPERCTEKVNVYHLNLQNYKLGARLYGILCVPKKAGKYPAILHVPGAGIRPYYGDVKTAEQGIITLQIGIHGIPVTMDPGVYDDMRAGWDNQYWTYNMDDRDKYYYKKVFMGCVRANDFLVAMPEFDGQNLAVEGGSQGGALSIITAGLDNRVKYLAAYYPAMSDMTGYLKGRAGGWPHIFDKNNPNNNTPQKISALAYYDVVNFAKQVKIPGVYTWGFNDETCPPTSMYPAYNKINASKELWIYQETGHWTYPEQVEKMNNWLIAKLKGN